jgi:hypothetical protein
VLACPRQLLLGVEDPLIVTFSVPGQLIAQGRFTRTRYSRLLGQRLTTLGLTRWRLTSKTIRRRSARHTIVRR